MFPSSSVPFYGDGAPKHGGRPIARGRPGSIPLCLSRSTIPSPS
jgi:hypothetical protein